MAKKTTPNPPGGTDAKTSTDFARTHQEGVSLLAYYTGRKSHEHVGFTPKDKSKRPNGPKPEEMVYFSHDTDYNPHILERQEILTKITINTALQAVLEECLDAGEAFEKIRQRGLFKPIRSGDGSTRPIDWHSFCAAAEIDPKKDLMESVKAVGLRKFSNRLKNKGLICTSADLLEQIQPGDIEPYTPVKVKGAIKDSTTGEIQEFEAQDAIPKHPALSAFYDKLVKYNHEQDNYKRARLEYVLEVSNYAETFRQYLSSQGSDEPMDKPVMPKEPKNPAVERPVDPRIELFNNLFGVKGTKDGKGDGFITLYETGAKLWETSAIKLSKSKSNKGEPETHIEPPIQDSISLNASDLRDGNRITVIPRNFGIVDRLIAIMGQRSNTFVQPPKITAKGHFDQKTFTDIRRVENGKVSQKAGLVAEIKVEEMHIHEADCRTHPIYKLMLRMEEFENRKITPNTAQAKSMMDEYNRLITREGHSLSFPTLKKRTETSDFIHPNELRKVYIELRELSQAIYAEAMREAPDEWQRIYIKAALQLNHDAGRESLPEDILSTINPKLFAKVKKSFVPEVLNQKEGHGKS